MLTQALLLPLFSALPKGIMAAIILQAAIALIHLDQFRFIYRMRDYGSLALMGVVAGLTFFSAIEHGIAAGIAIRYPVLIPVPCTCTPKFSPLFF